MKNNKRRKKEKDEVLDRWIIEKKSLSAMIAYALLCWASAIKYKMR